MRFSIYANNSYIEVETYSFNALFSIAARRAECDPVGCSLIFHEGKHIQSVHVRSERRPWETGFTGPCHQY